MSFALSRNNQVLAKDIVLIDGFSSSGKSLIGPIFGYLKRSEQWQVDDFYEYMAALNYLGEISHKSFSALIKLKADKLIYNLRIGRGVNFRATDLSSPYYDGLQDIYLQRLNNKEGNVASEEIEKCRPILPINIHYIFGYSKSLLDGFGDRLRLYILVLRDPFVLIDEWHKGKWIDRICSHNREFSLCIEYGKELIPWYALEYADEYLNSTDLEKSILTIYNLYIRVIKMYKNLSFEEKDKLMVIFFEEFTYNPEKYIDQICQILDTEKTDYFDKILKKSSLPRNETKDNLTTLDKFSDKYNKEVSEDFYRLLQNLESQYLDFYSEIISSKS